MLKFRVTVSFCAIIFVQSSHVTRPDWRRQDWTGRSADQDGSASLLYCSGSDIGSFNLSSRRDSTLMSGIPEPGVVDYHYRNKELFWTDDSNIYRAPLWQEGARPSVLIRAVESFGLAVDWMHNLIYWATYENSAVEVARLDGSTKRTLFEEEGIRPWAIVLNPAEGFMMWSDYGYIKKIERCNMDGSNRKVIIKEDISLASSLAIDLGSRRIFWVDYNKKYLSSSTFDGNHRRNLITQLKGPYSLDVYGKFVYYVTRQSNHEAIYKASKVDGSGSTKVFNGMKGLRSLKVFDPSKQSEGFSVCGDNNGGCSHLCLPKCGHTFSCACPNDRNMSGDNFNCLNPDGTAVITPSSTSTSPSSQLPFTFIQPNFTSSNDMTTTVNSKKADEDIKDTFTEENKNQNVDTTSGSSGIHGTLAFIIASVAVVIASVALIAMVGMMIYFRQFLITHLLNADTKNPVRKKNADENMYMEALS